MKLQTLFVASAILFGFNLHLSANTFSIQHEATPAEAQYARKINNSLKFKTQRFAEQISHVPTTDTEHFAYVLLSAYSGGMPEILELRKQIALNLPENVKLVVLTTRAEAKLIFELYSQWIDPNRLIIASDSSFYNRNGFWARDSFPIPVRNTETHQISLIAHQYYRPFDSFAAVANSVSAKFQERDEVFVGGNLLADVNHNCFVVDSVRLYDMNPEAVKNVYGCKTMTAFEHIAGIGDIDEVLKPMDNNIMLTNQASYVPKLEALGYKVVMLPNLQGTYRTHVNSLIVDNVAFMPAFGIKEDAIAQKVYENLGYKVVQIRTNYLSDFLRGSIHCQTMAYPAIEQSQLFHSLGIQEIQISNE